MVRERKKLGLLAKSVAMVGMEEWLEREIAAGIWGAAAKQLKGELRMCRQE